MSRFSQSTNNFYSTVSYTRPATSDIKNHRARITSTGEGVLGYNTISNFRPQAAQTGVMIRSSSSSFRNTKGKLELLGEKLTELLDDVKATRSDAKVRLKLHRKYNCILTLSRNSLIIEE